MQGIRGRLLHVSSKGLLVCCYGVLFAAVVGAAAALRVPSAPLRVITDNAPPPTVAAAHSKVCLRLNGCATRTPAAGRDQSPHTTLLLRRNVVRLLQIHTSVPVVNGSQGSSEDADNEDAAQLSYPAPPSKVALGIAMDHPATAVNDQAVISSLPATAGNEKSSSFDSGLEQALEGLHMPAAEEPVPPKQIPGQPVASSENNNSTAAAAPGDAEERFASRWWWRSEMSHSALWWSLLIYAMGPCLYAIGMAVSYLPCCRSYSSFFEEHNEAPGSIGHMMSKNLNLPGLQTVRCLEGLARCMTFLCSFLGLMPAGAAVWKDIDDSCDPGIVRPL